MTAIKVELRRVCLATLAFGHVKLGFRLSENVAVECNVTFRDSFHNVLLMRLAGMAIYEPAPIVKPV
jgi:hypothetical protein